ncbi:hypothetical protein FT663_03131 [Candidozyma haemuli var. vulneris]|uniref:Protein EFR3 n=1 Tax=Candidozyma haemuli TaxID=45357 RepID=A0A2V1AXT1_9ASCO|nr:hypothetical protein CXQ85_005196 [[Candida] haemuloni]KAF3984957.1 hypothetical protein FT662_05444 [[Candida] haemuloni var. vulneris]KAF3990572.1 hypothetical protein FT663_03131 [[Candida] haemuloni var. vulneris]PVH22622.1 hypothetical protein CXQ85_005196 [[Candida] haemuloni]
MRIVPQHKHQKLILQCYPPGKLADKKPNPSELSYLLYYASTRRIKLVKVVDFLAAKTKRDVKGNKSGNLQVTLGIISALIEKCADNLNAFATQVVSILSTILSVKELPLCKSLVSTYGVLCSKLDGGLFSGDKSFVESFTRFTESFIKTGVTQSSSSTTNKSEWRLVSLSTAKHVFNCLGFNVRLSKKFISSCVPLLAQTVLANATQSNLLTRLNSNLNVEGDEKFHSLNRVVTARTAAQAKEIEEHFESDSVSDSDLNEEALAALKGLFNTSLSTQISEATNEVVEFNFANAAETEVDNWGTTFLEMCASWIPVQLRFIALSTLLTRLSSASEKTDANSKNYGMLVHTAKSLLGLVSSNFNMIGLSISDVIQQFLTLQTNLHLSLADYLSVDQVRELSKIYTQCVCNLSSHIYYFDQVQDSIEGILMQVDSVMLHADTHKTSRVHDLVIVLLDNISKVMNLLIRKSSSITRNEATLENWDLGLQLLTVEKSYEEYASEASAEQKADLEAKFLQVFHEFLEIEFLKTGGKSSPRKASPKIVYSDASQAEGPERFLVPDYNEYISHSQNFLSNILVHTNEYLASPSSPSVSKLLLKTLQTLLSVTGINFVHNFIPVFSYWQLLDGNGSAIEVEKDKFAYSLLKSSVEVLNEKYADLLETDITTSSLWEAITHDISDRRAALSGAAGTFKTRVTQDKIYEFFATTSLNNYINPQKSVSLDVSKIHYDHEARANAKAATADNNSDHFQDARDKTAQPNGNGQGYGLGNANDISSIHSGLASGPAKSNGNAANGDASITQDTLNSNNSFNLQHTNNYRYSLLPKVSDLKNTVNGQTPDDRFSFHQNSTPRSVLQKHTPSTDMRTILKSLSSEEDKDIVV